MGSNRIKIERLTDYLLPMQVLVKSGIYPAAFEDGVDLSLPDLINEFYLGAFADEGLIGFYRVQQMGKHLYQAHANILTGYRRKYAISASEAALQYVAEKIEGFETLIAMIPAPFEAVQKHVQAIGLKFIGAIPNGFKKQGEFVDIHLFAITKKEIKCRQQ